MRTQLPPPFYPMHHHLSLKILSNTHRCGPYQDTIDPFSTPKPSSGLFRPTTSPPVCFAAPRTAPRTLVLLLGRRLGRPSFPPVPDVGAFLLTLPHPSSDHCFSRAVIPLPPPLETVDHPSGYGFSRQYLWLHLQDNRTAQLPREHRDQSYVAT